MGHSRRSQCVRRTQVHFISVMGNARANLFWECRLPEGFQRPREGDMRQLSTYINAKYAPAHPCPYGSAAQRIPCPFPCQ